MKTETSIKISRVLSHIKSTLRIIGCVLGFLGLSFDIGSGTAILCISFFVAELFGIAEKIVDAKRDKTIIP